MTVLSSSIGVGRNLLRFLKSLFHLYITWMFKGGMDLGFDNFRRNDYCVNVFVIRSWLKKISVCPKIVLGVNVIKELEKN